MKTVQFYYVNGEIKVNPDPVYLKVGEELVWGIGTTQIQYAVTQGNRMHMVTALALTWQVEFVGVSPFLEQQQTIESNAGQPDNGASAGKARKPGRYKYNVAVNDKKENRRVGHVDPVIIVEE